MKKWDPVIEDKSWNNFVSGINNENAKTKWNCKKKNQEIDNLKIISNYFQY